MTVNSEPTKRFFYFIFFLIFPSLIFPQERKIKPGDMIEIIVYDHPELSNTVLVSSNGTIDYPFMQSIPVDGLTLEQLRKVIIAQLSAYSTSPPMVTAIFSRAALISVNVQGQVANPGVVQVPYHSRLQGALQQAGKILPGASQKAITIIRKEGERAITTTYNLEQFMLDGDLEQNPLLKDEDLIVVTGNPVFAQVKVLGNVNVPGTYDNFPGATILDMIFMAGGFKEDANSSKIMYISMFEGKKEERTMELDINLSRYFKNPQTYHNLPIVAPGDVIIVRTKKTIWASVWAATKEALVVAQLLYWIVLYQYYRKR